jgi:hypothetical protein
MRMAQEEERKASQRQRGNQGRRSEAGLLHAQTEGLGEELVCYPLIHGLETVGLSEHGTAVRRACMSNHYERREFESGERYLRSPRPFTGSLSGFGPSR